MTSCVGPGAGGDTPNAPDLDAGRGVVVESEFTPTESNSGTSPVWSPHWLGAKRLPYVFKTSTNDLDSNKNNNKKDVMSVFLHILKINTGELKKIERPIF